MASQVYRLGTDEFWSALDAFDPVEVLVEALLKRNGLAGQASAPPARLSPCRDEERMLLDDPETDTGRLLNRSEILALQGACLVTLSAQRLLAPGVATAGLLCSGFTAQLQLLLLARYLPCLSHVALCSGTEGPAQKIEPGVLDQLELAGIGLSITPSVEEALLGANLVVVTMPVDLEFQRLARGALLINAGGQPIPGEVLRRVDQVYLDNPEGRHTTLSGGNREDRVDAHLVQVLTGEHPGRQRFDDILLVELLDVGEPEPALAHRLHQVAPRTAVREL